jgi:protein-S-isoprenylcysteine O-methyltransferase Ste14
MYHQPQVWLFVLLLSLFVVAEPQGYRSSFLTPQWRLRLTGLGGLALFISSWLWGRAEMTAWSFLPGAVITGCGLLLRMWASGWLCKRKRLTTAGPYALTRNPLYLGSGLIAVGHSFMSGVPLAPVLFPLLWIVLYWPTMCEEADYLAARYGAEYEAYRGRVPMLVPRLWPGRPEKPSLPVLDGDTQAEDSVQKFSWPRMLHYYKGFIANVLMIVIYGLLNAAR